MRGVMNEELTSREFAVQEHEKEMAELQFKHDVDVKKLELEVARVEAKWSSWLRIPVTLIKLPVYCLLAVGFIITSFREDKEPGQNFWDVIKK